MQKNLVYVIGLNPTIRDEHQLLQTLRGKDYFGQYGDIEKIVVSKAKPGGNSNQGIGVYVTYSKRADAATCIATVDGSPNGDRILRAQFGTTKYCSSFLRNEPCGNRNCTFLHETGEESESYTRQDLSSMNTLTAQRQGHPNGSSTAQGPLHTRYTAQSLPSVMRHQPSKDDAARSQPVPDGPALPSSASWANKDPPINRTRRTSITNSQASQSPRPQAATTTVDHRNEKQAGDGSSKSKEPAGPETQVLHNLLKAVSSADFKFVFSSSLLSQEEMALVENHPSFIDPYGGVKRRAMREKVEQERASREREEQSISIEEEAREGGSLQLGGEPDDAHPPRGVGNSRDEIGAIQPPTQQTTATSSAVGSPVSTTNPQFQGLNAANGARSLTPLQQQQLMLLKSANNQQVATAAGLVDPLQQTGLNHPALDQTVQLRQGLLNQMARFNALQAQNRQSSSRFSFGNDSDVAKGVPNARMVDQQTSLMQAGTPNPLATPSPNAFYATSGVQGPPPGLKTAGTPPVSGGGMFAQGHGFTTSNVNLGLGSGVGKQEANPDVMRELLRGRSGTNGLQGQETAKRESIAPFLLNQKTPRPHPSVIGFLDASQKQKKKGKKQRHANASSGGGGVVDLADPSILQARMHQVGANAAGGQALYGNQGQGGFNQSMVYGAGIGRW